MAKASSIRMVETEEESELRSLVDNGTKIDNDIKNLQFKAEANKSSILVLAKDEIKDSEKSVRFIAEKSNVLLTRTEKVEFSKKEKSYLKLLKAVETKSAPSELTFKEEYKLTKNIDRVLELSEENGLLDPLDKKTTISVSAEDFKSMSKTGKLDESIKDCGELSPSFKVKYEIKED